MSPSTHFAKNLVVCHRCQFREQGCRGACRCLWDQRDIVDHAAEHDCPLERFARRGLGDWVGVALHRLGIAAIVKAWVRRRQRMDAAPPRAGCGCRERRERLNQWWPSRG